jgi:hypothetical protein
MYHISLAYELLLAVSIIIPYDIWFQILRWWHLTWEITSAHKELKCGSSCAFRSWILSYHLHMTPRLNCLLNLGFPPPPYFPPELAGWVCHWEWKCPCLFRNFKGWGLLSLSEDSQGIRIIQSNTSLLLLKYTYIQSYMFQLRGAIMGNLCLHNQDIT